MVRHKRKTSIATAIFHWSCQFLECLAHYIAIIIVTFITTFFTYIFKPIVSFLVFIFVDIINGRRPWMRWGASSLAIKPSPKLHQAATHTSSPSPKTTPPIESSSNAKSSSNLPSASLLMESHPVTPDVDPAEHQRLKHLLEEKLACFGIQGSVTAIHPGPVITQFEYQLAKETKLSKVVALEDDLAMAMTANSVRILAPIPGKNAVGFEIARNHPAPVYFDSILSSPAWFRALKNFSLPLLFGTDCTGNAIVEDLARMPHLLVAGSTGSGKSVCMHAMISSLLMSHTPTTMRLILIDPKRLEFSPYGDIPHLLMPVVTHMEKVPAVLAWVTAEMERRYEMMSNLGVRTIDELPSSHQLPRLVLFIDELADLMMIGGREIEFHIVRIAQMARAAGIHLVVATQRPSVDVVTGLIKVNFPSRISFRVTSRVDSRTILDEMGAERLLGRGDMLIMNPSTPYLRRAHGAYISSSQVERLASHLRSTATPVYITFEPTPTTSTDESDELFDAACEFAKERDEVSISGLQRHLRIGFNRSARLIEQLEKAGIVAPAQGSKPRRVL